MNGNGDSNVVVHCASIYIFISILNYSNAFAKGEIANQRLVSNAQHNKSFRKYFTMREFSSAVLITLQCQR